MNIQHMDRVGDVLVQFGNPQPLSGRWGRLNAGVLAQEPGWRLLSESPRKGWFGYPFKSLVFGGWRVWVIGELYGSKDRTLSDEGFVEELVLGKVKWSQLNGHVAILGWDSTRREWHIWTDRFGTLHLFHCSDRNGPMLGTSFQSVSCHQAVSKLDWAGISGLFGCGFFPEDRTHFENVRILKPATETVLDEHGKLVSSQRYWEWSHEPDTTRSPGDLADEFGHVFLRIMGEMTSRDRVAVPISGGLDSRSTLAGLGVGGARSGGVANLWGYSYGYSDDSIETRISSELARCRGLAFQRFTIRPYLSSRLDTILGCIEGFQDLLQCRQAFVIDELAEHSDHVIAAHWGDVWHDDMGFDASRDATGGDGVAAHAFEKMAKRGRRWLWDQVCARSAGGLNPELVTRGFVEEGIGRVRGIQDPDFRVKAFKTDNWSFRWTLSSIRMFQAASFPRLPFYDTRVADFFLRVPTGRVSGRAMQLEFLRRFAPDLARVEWQETGTDLFDQGRGKVGQLARRVTARLERLLLNKPVVERNWEVQLRGVEGRELLQQYLLREGLAVHELVGRKEVQDLVNLFQSEPLVDGRGYTVSMLFSFSAWLEARLRRGKTAESNQLT